jgi:hypothetical protein
MRSTSSPERSDLRAVPLLNRKRLLVKVLPKSETRALHLDQVVKRGRDLYDVACGHDLKDVAKWAPAATNPRVARSPG